MASAQIWRLSHVWRVWQSAATPGATQRTRRWGGEDRWWSFRRRFARMADGIPVTGSSGSVPVESAESFEAFFQRFGADIFGYLWRMTGEEQTAYDLSQETFLRAWRHFDRVRAYDRPGAWLYRVATNIALNYLKRRGVAHAVLAPLSDDDPTASAGAQSDPQAAVAEHDQVRAVLLDLAPRGRAALVLHDVCGLTSEEVGRAIGIAPGAARMLLCRAREQFRARYLRQEARR